MVFHRQPSTFADITVRLSFVGDRYMKVMRVSSSGDFFPKLLAGQLWLGGFLVVISRRKAFRQVVDDSFPTVALPDRQMDERTDKHRSTPNVLNCFWTKAT